MSSRFEYEIARKEAAKRLEEFTNDLSIQIARTLQRWEEYIRLCEFADQKPKFNLPIAYFDAVYRILCFGTNELKAKIVLGNTDSIEACVSKVQRDKGFRAPTGEWIDV